MANYNYYNNLTNRFKKNISIEQKDKTHKPAFDKPVYEGYNGEKTKSYTPSYEYESMYDNTQNQWGKPETRRRDDSVYSTGFRGNNIIKDGFNVYNLSFKGDPGFLISDNTENPWKDTFKKKAQNQWYNKIAHGSFKEDDWFDSMVENQEKAENWYKNTYGEKIGEKEYNNLHNRLVTTPFDKIKDEEKQFANYKASDFKVPELTKQPKYSYDFSSIINEAIEIEEAKKNASNTAFDYNTRLSYNQKYDENVKILQKRLSKLGYLDMSDGGWGYFGPRTEDAVNRYKTDNGLGNTGADKGVVGKQTWASLGLLYREPEDVEAGVKIITIGDKQYFDITDAVIKAVQNDEALFKENGLRPDWFINQVKNEGKWNVKANSKQWSEALGISANTYDKPMLFNGKQVVIDDIGNITYGYLGKAAGYFDVLLDIGSAGYHIWNNIWNDELNILDGWDNEFADQKQIQVGIDL